MVEAAGSLKPKSVGAGVLIAVLLLKVYEVCPDNFWKMAIKKKQL
jgi:hypothetical protein